jgi:hypothetical protein
VRCAGSQFDDAVVRAFVAVSIGRLRRVMGPSALVAQIPVLGPLLLTPTLGAAAPLASAAVVVGGLAGPAVLSHEAASRPTVVQAASATTSAGSEHGTTSADDTPEPAGPRQVPAAGEGAPAAGGPVATTPEAPPTTPTDPTDPTGPVPTVPPLPTTPTTTPPGLLTPVVDPVTDDVVDPVVDTVDELVPGLGVGDTVDDLRCLLPLLGCP